MLVLAPLCGQNCMADVVRAWTGYLSPYSIYGIRRTYLHLFRSPKTKNRTKTKKPEEARQESGEGRDCSLPSGNFLVPLICLPLSSG